MLQDCWRAGTLIKYLGPNVCACAALSCKGFARQHAGAWSRMRPMDRLLQILLDDFIRRGTFRSTTSRGKTFTFGDGTGGRWPCALPLMQPNGASCSIPNSNSAKPTWTARWWSRRARSPTSSRSCSDKMQKPPHWAPAAMVAALHCTAPDPVQSAPSEPAATSRIITISTGGSTHSSSMPTGSTAAAISKRLDTSLDDAQLAKKRHLAAKLIARS